MLRSGHRSILGGEAAVQVVIEHHKRCVRRLYEARVVVGAPGVADVQWEIGVDRAHSAERIPVPRLQGVVGRPGLRLVEELDANEVRERRIM